MNILVSHFPQRFSLFYHKISHFYVAIFYLQIHAEAFYLPSPSTPANETLKSRWYLLIVMTEAMVIMQNNDNCNDRGNGAKQCDGKSKISLFLNSVQYGVVLLVMFFITNKIDFTSFLCSSSCSSSSSFLLVPTAVSLPPASRASILSSQAVEVSLSLSS